MFFAKTDEMSRYLISYDIRESRIRNRIFAILEKAGMRIQKSVFIVNCPENSFRKLASDLHELLGDDDSLLCMPCCAQCYSQALMSGNEQPLLIIK